MKKKNHCYTTPGSIWIWLMTMCMAGSLTARIFSTDFHGGWELSILLLLPMAATTLFVVISLLDGAECLYRTAVPMWLMAGYCGLWLSRNIAFKPIVWGLWAALFLLAVIYTQWISGSWRKREWPVFAGIAILLAAVLSYMIRTDPAFSWLKLLPGALFLTGCIVFYFAVQTHPAGESHRTWGDRSDGRRIRSISPMDQVSPYIMVERNTATNSFEDSFEITNVERYIRQKRQEGLTSFGIMHVFLAAYCRAMARYPGLNRFISGQKVYSRGEDIQFCLTIKKEMSTKSPETIVKVHLSPRDSVYDVYNKVNAEIEKAKNTPLDSNFDNTAQAFMMIPGVVLKFVVWLLKLLDYFGMIPAFLLEISPFHGSIFFTSMGSLGIPPIYHHLYDFGNLPVFGAFGCKRRAYELQEDGSVVQRKYIDFKFSMDERIVDGYYYAAFFKHFKRIIAHPEIMDTREENITADID